MKRISIFLMIPLVLLACGCSSKRGAISISGAFALYPMTVKWAEEFQVSNPDVQIDISAGGAGKGMADALSGMVDLGMFSREVTPEELEQGAWYIALTKDAVLPTINASNPFIDRLMEQGVAKEDLYRLFVSGDVTTWNELLGDPPVNDITLFTRSDACGAAAMWAAYLGVNQEDLLGLGVFGDPGVADAVKADKYGFGYNNVAYVYDIATRNKFHNMEVLPTDLDGNGKITPDEDFYGTLDEVMEAIRSEKYPSPPARELYFVAHGKPEKEVVIQFIEWILTDGQKYLKDAGYVELSDQRIREELDKLHG